MNRIESLLPEVNDTINALPNKRFDPSGTRLIVIDNLNEYVVDSRRVNRGVRHFFCREGTMKKFTLRFIVALLTFVIGTVAATLWALNHYRMPAKSEKQSSISITPTSPPKVSIPVDWYKVNADGRFTFHLPKSMKLSSTKMSEEAGWGSTFSDKRVNLYAESSSWPVGYAAEYLAKQFEYEKEIIEISGRKAKVHSWRWSEPSSVYKYEAELRIYGAQDKMLVRMLAECKERQDVEVAKQIFRTVEFP